MSDLDDLGRELAALFPVATRQRGWTVANLEHGFEQTAWGVEETWRCDIYGPTDIWSEWHRFANGSRTSTAMIRSGTTGTIEAPTREALIQQVKYVVDTLGIADLKAP